MPLPTDTPTEVTAKIPVYHRGKVFTSTQVDQADLERWGHLRWRLHSAGYAGRWMWHEGRKYHALLHRVILGLKPGDQRQVDHINRNPLDNRRTNLRIVPGQHVQPQNMRSNRGGSSRFRGVCWDSQRQKWLAGVQVDGRTIYCGRFDVEAEAAEAAAAARAFYLPYSEEAYESAR